MKTVFWVNNLRLRKHDGTQFIASELLLNPGVYGIFGPNNSGKSFLLRQIAGAAWTGQIQCGMKLNGQNLSEFERKRLLGYVPQQLAFYEEMPVRKFMSYMGKMKLVPAKQQEEAINLALATFGLDDKNKERIYNLSMGEKRRLSIAQALLNDPKLIVLDEPTKGLDLPFQLKLMQELSRRSKDSVILIAEHLLSMTVPFVDELLFMKNRELKGPKTETQWRYLYESEKASGQTPTADGKQRSVTLEEIYFWATSSF